MSSPAWSAVTSADSSHQVANSGSCNDAHDRRAAAKGNRKARACRCTIAGDDVTDVEINCSDNSILLSSHSLTYGDVSAGSQSTYTVTVTNNGSADVVITGLSDPAAPFRITGGSCTQLPVTLVAGESCVIDVLFNPVDEGSFNSSFQIISNASSSPNVVSLSGTSQIFAIPTLSQWALMLMALLMLGMAYKHRQFF